MPRLLPRVLWCVVTGPRGSLLSVRSHLLASLQHNGSSSAIRQHDVCAEIYPLCTGEPYLVSE